MNAADRFASYLAIPWLEKGRSREGLDCWGLVWLLYRDCFGIELPLGLERYTSALDRRENARVIEGGLPDWRRLAEGEEQPGDVLLLARHGVACHVAVLVRPGWVMHIRAGSDVHSAPLHRLDREGFERVGYFRHQARR